MERYLKQLDGIPSFYLGHFPILNLCNDNKDSVRVKDLWELNKNVADMENIFIIWNNTCFKLNISLSIKVLSKLKLDVFVSFVLFFFVSVEKETIKFTVVLSKFFPKKQINELINLEVKIKSYENHKSNYSGNKDYKKYNKLPHLIFDKNIQGAMTQSKSNL